MIIPAVIMAAFLAVGIPLSLGKGSEFITSFSGKKEQQKDGFDAERQTKLMGSLMLACAGCMLIALIGKLAGFGWLHTAGYCLLVPCAVVFTVIDMNGKK